jgi:hypothetical protein
MRTKKIPKKALEKTETIFETDYRLKKKAIEISKNFVHTKPIKYLLK